MTRQCPRCGSLLSDNWATELCGSCSVGSFQFGTPSTGVNEQWADGNRAACDFFHRKKLRELTSTERQRIEELKADIAVHDNYRALLAASRS